MIAPLTILAQAPLQIILDAVLQLQTSHTISRQCHVQASICNVNAQNCQPRRQPDRRHFIVRRHRSAEFESIKACIAFNRFVTASSSMRVANCTFLTL